MEDNKNNLNDPALESLANRLKDLPEVTPSQALEARLLAAIPQDSVPDARSNRIRPSRWFVAAGVAAAIVILAIVLRFADVRETSPPLVPDPAAPALATSSRHISGHGQGRPEETRPCDIVPPLPH